MDDYLRDFVQETDDQITDLNNALLDLENDPGDEDAMDRIFRTAHTIKGNCGAMGFTKAADLAHAVEDLLDEMRAGRVAVTSETMDEVFRAVDTLEEMVEEVREHEQPQTDPREVIDSLRAVLEEAPGPDERIEEPTDEQIETTLSGIEGPAESDHLVYHVRLAVSEADDVEEGMLVLEALADAFDVLGTNPPQNVIRNEDYGGSFDAIVSSAISDEDITAALNAVDQVEEVIVTDVSDRLEMVGDDVEPVEVDDMEVEELLDSVSEFDDIESMADEMDEEEAMAELDDAGTFDELDVESDDDDIEIEDLLEEEEEAGELADETEIEESDLGEMEDLETDESDDAGEVFDQLQEEVDEVKYEELEPELEALEFDEFDEDEELSFDELVDETEPGVRGEDDLEAFDSEFDDEEGDDFEELFEEEGGEAVGDEELDEVLAEAEETVGEDEEVTFDELVGDADESLEPGELDDAFDETGEGAFEEADAGGESGGVDLDDAFADTEVQPPESAEEAGATDDATGIGSSAADSSASDSTAADPSAAGDASTGVDAGGQAESAGERSAGEPDAGTGGESPTEPGERDIGEIESIRVNVDDVDSLLNQVEQLVTNRLRLGRAIEEGDLDQAESELDELETLTGRMQDTVMDIRLVPLSQVVGNLPRLVRDLSRDQGKEVDFAVQGGDVELDRRILSELGDPLMHLVRNSVDHGIEPPDEREAAGKPREGKLRITAQRTRDRVTIEVTDDGRGLDTDAIAEQAMDEGLVTDEDVAAMDDDEVRELIFEPGFSTAEEVTGVSGRGVGMDVVRETVRDLDGAVSIDSMPGEGTTVRLRVPVSVAIVRMLFVRVGDEEFGIPVKNVDEISRTATTERVEGEEVLTYGDDIYPLVRLDEALDVDGAAGAASAEAARADGGEADDLAIGPGEEVGGRLAAEEGQGSMYLRMSEDVRKVALECDGVMRQEEVVVKPYEGLLSGIPGLSGAAVLGEGDVVNIIDVETL